VQSDVEAATETQVEAEVEEELAGLDVDSPLVGIVMGSKSDLPIMEKAASELRERGIMHEVRVMSAHREPQTVAEYARNARMRGLRVPIPSCRSSASPCAGRSARRGAWTPCSPSPRCLPVCLWPASAWTTLATPPSWPPGSWAPDRPGTRSMNQASSPRGI
jgi:hypothetical protein